MSAIEPMGYGVGRQAKRVALSICLLLSGCRGAGFDVSYSPGAGGEDYRLREDCLYRTLCPEIGRRGGKDLEGAAAYASSLCEEPILQKMRQRTASARGPSDDEISKEHMAQLEFDWHAMAVAQELKDRCGGSPTMSQQN
jgi:hypothetical protein